ncbi:hypothetical protein PAPYR_8368 [Paratrimastix pyriformis]|uniref:Uncharacterized protein n=1 Tax=Paratrimastix pyriformis TaxID=342808 RepID=A0ABQ8UAS4_9EUKA|nr:hypothetical protein PAPYR_8368 [Paratrimastix pyriformis]
MGNSVGDAGARALAESLDINNHLQFLGLENNDIKEDGAIALAAVFDRNQTLDWLALEENLLKPKQKARLAERYAGRSNIHLTL